MVELFPHQIEALESLKSFTSCAIGYDMGLGKTFIGSEKMKSLNTKVNLVVCQKSKVDDWVNHFKMNYEDFLLYDLTDKRQFQYFILDVKTDALLSEEALIYYGRNHIVVAVINYDILFRRPELLKLQDFTLMLDESSMIQHSNTKRTDFILKMKPKNVILLSGTFTNGRLENLYTQAYLTGYNITKSQFEKLYTVKALKKMRTNRGTRFFNEIVGYQNEEHLFKKLHDLGWIFKKTDEVISLPDMNFQTVKIQMSKEYKRFKIDKVFIDEDKELIGDTPMKRFLYLRMMSGMYSKEKLQAVEDILNSTNERVIIFYNFIEECNQLEAICKKLGKPIAYMNGSNKDMSAYEEHEDSVILIQYQSGSFGLNLQKCCHTVYFTPPLSTEQYEQSKARTRRIGQSKPCFYYNLVMSNSIEEKIYQVLAKRQDFTNRLFEEEYDV